MQRSVNLFNNSAAAAVQAGVTALLVSLPTPFFFSDFTGRRRFLNLCSGWYFDLSPSLQGLNRIYADPLRRCGCPRLSFLPPLLRLLCSYMKTHQPFTFIPPLILILADLPPAPDTPRFIVTFPSPLLDSRTYAVLRVFSDLLCQPVDNRIVCIDPALFSQKVVWL